MMKQRAIWSLILLLNASSALLGANEPDFNADVMPVFRAYCLGCHNAKEAEGGLVLDDHARTLRGGDSGTALTAGRSDQSRLWQVLSGGDPKMPPEGNPSPKPSELALIKTWIDAGAKPPAKGLAGLITPKIQPQGTAREPITGLAADPSGKWLAIARPAGVAIVSLPEQKALKDLTGHAGAVSDVIVSADGKWLVVAAGEIGLGGEATLWATSDWSRGRVVAGHADALYSATLSPDGTTLATGSYDKAIHLWETATGTLKATMPGHNDAVYSLAFHPLTGQMLASASGDRTVKLWDVASGERLDTFSQPSKEQYSAAFSPDGKLVAAGGADHRIRIWSVSESGKEGSNPLLYARFAHEGPVLKVVFSPDGRLLASSSQDRRIKIWESQSFTQVGLFDHQSDWAAALAFSPDSRTLFAGRMNGELARFEMDPRWGDRPSALERLAATPSGKGAGESALKENGELEPNDTPAEATSVTWPGTVAGVLEARGGGPDADLYRLGAKAGEAWILETNAMRSGSPADTKLEVLDSAGAPLLRGVLQAVRDSWINFRPIDSSSTDVRVEFWEEMDLNQFLYMNGEVCKLFRAPRGPDSGYGFYENQGKRRTYFDTSSTAQAKDQPVYIVEAYPAGSSIVENGLPTFPLYYLNDDDGERELGNDSRLTFVAPRDGEYLIRVTDARGFSGSDFRYRLTARPPRPDFQVRVETRNLKVPAGSGQRIVFSLDRIDNFDGPVRLDVSGVPAGYQVASPVLIEAGHLKATSVLTADASAQPVSKEAWDQVKIAATATIAGQTVTHAAETLGEITLEKPSTIRVTLTPDQSSFTAADGGLVIVPGTTITALLKIERIGFDGDVRFDVDGLPHGIIVDNIGLSGILVRAHETERQVFLTARPWVPETTHLIDAVAQGQGNPASGAIPLHVRSDRNALAAKSTAAE